MLLKLQPVKFFLNKSTSVVNRSWPLTYEIGGRESGVLLFKENDEVRVNYDAVLAPEAIRGEIGAIRKIDRFLAQPSQLSEGLVAVDRYQQLV